MEYILFEKGVTKRPDDVKDFCNSFVVIFILGTIIVPLRIILVNEPDLGESV